MAAALICLAAGALVAFASLVRLGWRRHGASPLELGFLHIDWVLQPALSYWGAHVMNLLGLVLGLLLLGGGMALLMRRRPRLRRTP